MAHVVTNKCLGCKFTDCVEVCPVACFYELEGQLVEALTGNSSATADVLASCRRQIDELRHLRLGYESDLQRLTGQQRYAREIVSRLESRINIIAPPTNSHTPLESPELAGTIVNRPD